MLVKKIYGPPGTGKTTRLLSIMEQELKVVRPHEIAYLTFTRHARQEAMDRCGERFGFNKNDLPYFRTLHSIAYKELGLTSGALVTRPQDMRPLADRLGVTFTGGKHDLENPFPEPGGELGDRLLNFDHWRRHKLLSVDAALRSYQGDDDPLVVDRFMRSYEAWREQESVLDFTDMLLQVREPLPIKVAIVDEAQDLSDLQWSAFHTLAANAERVYIAGDDDQAIFTWAGASPSAFLEHGADDTEILAQSYRVPSLVAAAARAVIERVRHRQAKDWLPRPESGAVRFGGTTYDLPLEGTVRVLYRNHALSRDVEETLRAVGQPYSIGDLGAPGARWAKAIMAYEKMRRHAEVNDAERKEIEQAMSRERRPHLVLYLKEPWYNALDRIKDDDAQYLRSVLRHHGSKALLAEPRVKLSTIHASKGTEADHVVLLAGMSSRTLDASERDPDDERRVLYVGLTRARKSLTIVGDPADNPYLGI